MDELYDCLIESCETYGVFLTCEVLDVFLNIPEDLFFDALQTSKEKRGILSL